MAIPSTVEAVVVVAYLKVGQEDPGLAQEGVVPPDQAGAKAATEEKLTKMAILASFREAVAVLRVPVETAGATALADWFS